MVIDETKENVVSLYLPLNSVLWFSKTGKARLYADLIVNPWEILNSSQKILREEVREQDFRVGFNCQIQCDRGTLYNRR